jgi:hypothetical protein
MTAKPAAPQNTNPPATKGPSFQSRLPYNAERINAAAVYCSDGRYGQQMDEFLHLGLKLPRYDRIATPGGAACLATHTTTTRQEGSLEAELRFLIDAHELHTVVLIAHEDCGFYKRVRWSAPSLEAQQFMDLAKAAKRIRAFSADLKVYTFFSRKVENFVRFDQVES